MPHTCTHCAQEFIVTQADMEFYSKISPTLAEQKFMIPPPDKCFTCRQQRRMAWRNERTLYNRKCDFCQKEIIAMYTPEARHPVYCPSCFYSDKWDAVQYGQEYNFKKPFFEQFKELIEKVPVFSLFQQRQNENCDYTNFTSGNRNCYLVFAAADNEYAFYTTYLQRCKDISDCFFIFDSELCYECIDCYHCYSLLYSQGCQNCSDSALLLNCKACKHCFGCVNLDNKEYYIFNKPYSKEEYARQTQTLRSTREHFENARAIFQKLRLSLPHKYYSGYNNENFIGDHVVNSKNVEMCFDCSGIEDCKFCTWMHQSKSCYDCYAWGMPGELGYENQLCGNGVYNVQFSDSSGNDITNILYSNCVTNGSNNLFGCISLQKKSYCILNKQYTKEEYEALVPRVIQHMRSTEEWGKPLPISLSRFAYNETVAQEYAPLHKEQALALGARWKDASLSGHYQGKIPTLPYDINEVSDTILKEILTCKTCNKHYRLIAQELNLYRKLQIPAPENCFACRYKNRFQQRNPRKLWDRNCMRCSTPIHTTFAQERPEIVYCEKCYLETIY